MTDAKSTLEHALSLYDRSRERVTELRRALRALGANNGDRHAVRCAISVAQGTAWVIDVSATFEFVAPFVEAALLKEQSNLAKMERRLEAARAALQKDDVEIQ